MVNIKIKPGRVNSSPVMFHLYATQYYRCKQAFKHEEPVSPVPYFLLCRAIELEIKSRHLGKKSRSEVKREFGHSLIKAYNNLEISEQLLNIEEYEQLKIASSVYDIPNKGFEYCSVFDALSGYKSFPNLNVLDQIAAKLICREA